MPRYVKFSQHNGIVCYGEVLAEVRWDDVPVSVVRYWYPPDTDPPRKPYILIETRRLITQEFLPKTFVIAGQQFHGVG